jgi:uncharacterized protein (TIGR02001 family)
MRHVAVPSCLVITLGWLGAAAPSRAAELEVSAAVTVASDYFFRGISQTRNEPALQATVGVEHPSGWFGGLFASNVDFPDGPYGDDRNVELDAHLGYGRELGAGWAAVARAARYAYPNDDGQYDYGEVALGLEYRGVTASVGYTNQVLGYGGSGRVWELVGSRELPRQLMLNGGVGWYDLTGLDDHYTFWHVALARSLGHFAAELGYYGSDAAGRRLFGERAEARLVLGVSYGLR